MLSLLLLFLLLLLLLGGGALEVVRWRYLIAIPGSQSPDRNPRVVFQIADISLEYSREEFSVWDKVLVRVTAEPEQRSWMKHCYVAQVQTISVDGNTCIVAWMDNTGTVDDRRYRLTDGSLFMLLILLLLMSLMMLLLLLCVADVGYHGCHCCYFGRSAFVLPMNFC